MSMPKVLVVDLEGGALRASIPALEHAELEVTPVAVARAALKLVETRLYSVVVCGPELGEFSGGDFLARAGQAAPGVGLLLVARSEEIQASKPAAPPGERRARASETRAPGMRVLLAPYDESQLVATVLHLARMAGMRRSTHAMASIIAPRPDEPPISGEERPRTIAPRKG